VSARFLQRLHLAWARLVTGGLSQLRDWSSIEGWLSPHEALGLLYLARRLPPNATVVEIGSWKGKSTYCIARGLRSGTIHAIDPFDASGEAESKAIYSKKRGAQPLVEQFRENLRSRGVLDKVAVHPGYSQEFAGRFPAIDLLFIDGDHSREGCAFDFDTFSPALKPGGYLAFHDFDPVRDDLGPTWVVKNRVATNAGFKFFGMFDSLWVARRTRAAK
jgi:hypothetical protein